MRSKTSNDRKGKINEESKNSEEDRRISNEEAMNKTRFQQMADGLVSQLQSANKVSEEINLLTKQSAYLSEKDMENLKEVYKVELETPIQILHEIGMIEKDEDYLNKEG